MNKTLPTFKYLVKSSFPVILIGFVNVIFNAAISDLIFYLTAKQNGYDLMAAKAPLTMTFEFTTAIYMFIIGLIFFIPNFKTSLTNGVSRRSFFLANVPSIAVMAAVFAVWNALLILVHSPFVPVIQFTELTYPNAGLGSSLLLPFFFAFFAGVLGWLITLAYYRATTVVRWVISLAPFILLGVLIVFNVSSNGRLFEDLSLVYRVMMGTTSLPHNPFAATLSLASLTAVFCAIVYLVLRRTPLKD